MERLPVKINTSDSLGLKPFDNTILEESKPAREQKEFNLEDILEEYAKAMVENLYEYLKIIDIIEEDGKIRSISLKEDTKDDLIKKFKDEGKTNPRNEINDFLRNTVKSINTILKLTLYDIKKCADIRRNLSHFHYGDGAKYSLKKQIAENISFLIKLIYSNDFNVLFRITESDGRRSFYGCEWKIDRDTLPSVIQNGMIPVYNSNNPDLKRIVEFNQIQSNTYLLE